MDVKLGSVVGEPASRLGLRTDSLARRSQLVEREMVVAEENGQRMDMRFWLEQAEVEVKEVS